MALRVSALIAHAVLLLLASTSFTIVTGFVDGSFNWQYFSYRSQSGWGVPYQFPYRLSVVLTYLAANTVGIGAYASVWRSGSAMLGLGGVVLCGIGFYSFANEATHWLREHYESWIFSAPSAQLLWALGTLWREYRLHRSRTSTMMARTFEPKE